MQIRREKHSKIDSGIRVVRQKTRPLYPYRRTPDPGKRLDSLNDLFYMLKVGVRGDHWIEQWQNHTKQIARGRRAKEYEEIQPDAEIDLARSLQGKISSEQLVDVFLGKMKDGVVLSQTIYDHFPTLVRGPRAYEKSHERTSLDYIYRTALVIYTCLFLLSSFAWIETDRQEEMVGFLIVALVYLFSILANVTTQYIAPPVQPDTIQPRLAYLESVMNLTPDENTLSQIAHQLYSDVAKSNPVAVRQDLLGHPFSEDPADYRVTQLDERVFWAHLFENPIDIFMFCARYAPATMEKMRDSFLYLFTPDEVAKLEKLITESGETDPGIAINHHNKVCRQYARHVAPLANSVASLAINQGKRIFYLSTDSDAESVQSVRKQALNVLKLQPYSPLTTVVLSFRDLSKDQHSRDWIIKRAVLLLPHAVTATMAGDKRPVHGYSLEAKEAKAVSWLLFSVLAQNGDTFSELNSPEITQLWEVIQQTFKDNGGDTGIELEPEPVRKTLELFMIYDKALVQKYYDYLQEIVRLRLSNSISTSAPGIESLVGFIIKRLNKRALKPHNEVGYRSKNPSNPKRAEAEKAEWTCYQNLFISLVGVLKQNLYVATHNFDNIVNREVAIKKRRDVSYVDIERAQWQGKPTDHYFSHPAKVALIQALKLANSMIGNMNGLSTRLTGSKRREVITALETFDRLQGDAGKLIENISQAVQAQTCQQVEYVVTR